MTPRRLTYSTTSGRPLPASTRSRGPSQDQTRRRHSRETWDKERSARNPITERGNRADEGAKEDDLRTMINQRTQERGANRKNLEETQAAVPGTEGRTTSNDTRNPQNLPE